MFLFQCRSKTGAEALIRVSSVDWALSGDVTFSCNDDELACCLLTRCRSDSSGHFNLLAGCKPSQVEQWLEYLQERGDVCELSLRILTPGDANYPAVAGLDSEETQSLLDLFYRIGKFNRLQITRYMKQRGNAALLSTSYGKEELERYRLLNDVIRILSRLRRSSEVK